jgi:hypothetical protein
VLYAVLTVLFTYPLPFHLHKMDAGDSAFFAWAIGWELHALATDPASLPHGNMFHPMRYTLGMDEPVLGTTVLVAPLALFTDDAVWLHNVARLLTYALSALSAYVLARALGCAEVPALFGGAAFAFSPIRVDQIAHLSTLGTQWMPLVVLALVRFARTARVRDGLLAGALFAAQGYACGYHALIGLVVLPLAALPLVWGRWDRLPRAVPGILLGAALLVPLYLLHRAALQPLGYDRGPAETIEYSAAVESFLATGSWNRVWGEATARFRTVHSNNLFPGAVTPLLAVLGFAALRRAGRWPGRIAIALAVMALATVLVALGPEIRAFGHTFAAGPFALARELPVFRMIRVPSRSGAYLALALAMLAARALTLLKPRPAVLAAVVAAGLVETLTVPIPMPLPAQLVDSRQTPPVYAWLAAQPPDTVVAEMPILDIDGIVERPRYHESIYLVHSTRHWRRLVNGYAGIEPAPYLDLRQKALRFPSQASIEALRARGVRYVVVHRGGYGPNKWARFEKDLTLHADALREVARFDGDTVYELLAAAAPPP